jgi:predicted RNA-binding Zn ribbon-like protein
MTNPLPPVPHQHRPHPSDLPEPGLDRAIDFVNSFGTSRGRPYDDLQTADAAVVRLAELGFLTPADSAAERERLAAHPAVSGAALARLQAVRSGLRELIDATAEGRSADPDALASVNLALRLAEFVELVPLGSDYRLARRRAGEPVDQAIAAIARLVAAEVAGGRSDRLRICENPTCRWAFYDRSRPGTRRWCEMSSCGNRMKAARHRARTREVPSAVPPEVPPTT